MVMQVGVLGWSSGVLGWSDRKKCEDGQVEVLRWLCEGSGVEQSL
jgi:hypothetical protein